MISGLRSRVVELELACGRCSASGCIWELTEAVLQLQDAKVFLIDLDGITPTDLQLSSIALVYQGQPDTEQVSKTKPFLNLSHSALSHL